MKRTFGCALGLVMFTATQVKATPSTTVWAPSTTYIQPYLTPHLTYDTYFWNKIATPTAGSQVFPIDTGLTMGVLPFESVNLEVGFDLMLPSADPFLFNAKLGVPESALGGIVGVAVGIYGVGTKKTTDTALGTDYNVAYGQLQKNLPWGGYVSVGGYYGLGAKALFTGSNGKVTRAGFIGGIASPDIVIDKPWLKKIILAADVQTGKTASGAAGFSPMFYFTDTVSVLMGPIYFFDKAAQPGGAQYMWTVQLDVDMALLPAPAPAAAPTAAPAPAAAEAPKAG